MRNILVVTALRSFFTISMEEQLEEAGYHIINKGIEIDVLSQIKEDISGILIYIDSELLKSVKVFVYLRDKAVEDNIPFFVVGDKNEIADTRSIITGNLIKKEFCRPIDIKQVVGEIDEYIKNYGKKKKILVVDDSGVVLRNVKGWLEGTYQVVLANSGAMAIKYLSMNRPDLVLLDYEMPVVNGKQVLEMIRTENDFSDIPVMFLTGKNDRESIAQVMSLKPEGYILKSTKPEQIIKMIDEFFQKRKSI